MTFGDIPSLNEAQSTFRRELHQHVQECASEGPAVRSKKTNGTHAKYWAIFCERMGLEEECLGKGTVE